MTRNPCTDSSTASVRETLFSLQDPAYQAFQSKLCPGVDNIIGVRMPALRPLARKLARESGLLYFQEGPEDYYEELLLKAMVLAPATIGPPIERSNSFLYWLEIR